MIDFTIRERPDGSLVATFEHTSETYVIDKYVVTGIAEELVQGRDIDDGLAPVYVIAKIIEARFAIESIEVDSTKLIGEDNWLYTLVEHNQLGEYGITPMVAALSQLVIFGGEVHSIHI